MEEVYVHVTAAKEGTLKGIPMVAVFTTYEKLQKHEKFIEKREELEVLQVTKVKVDKRYESEDL